jgi:hypothetical protein
MALGCSVDAQSPARKALAPEQPVPIQAALEAGAGQMKLGGQQAMVDDAIVGRIVKQDSTLTDADVLRLLAPNAGTDYVKNFKLISKARPMTSRWPTCSCRTAPRSISSRGYVGPG